jgi:hypothetical protein
MYQYVQFQPGNARVTTKSLALSLYMYSELSKSSGTQHAQSAVCASPLIVQWNDLDLNNILAPTKYTFEQFCAVKAYTSVHEI